jgi:dynamin 1-like protein
MSDALDSETEFFRNHAAYRNIAHKNGTKYLARTLNQVLMNHIRDKLPDMKARLNTLMGQAQQELNSFGDAAIFGDKNQVSHSTIKTYQSGRLLSCSKEHSSCG